MKLSNYIRLFLRKSASGLVAGAKVESRLLKSAFWAVVDQALFSIASFGLNIILARRLSGEEYGAFSFISSLFLYVVAVHSALIVEPSFVFAPGKFARNPVGYIRTLIRLHGIVILTIGAGLLSAGLALAAVDGGSIAAAIIGMSFAGPIILSLGLLRRVSYVVLSPFSAARSGMIYMLLLGSIVGVLAFRHDLSILAGFMALTLSGACACVPLLMELLSAGRTQPSEKSMAVLKVHFEYGRWGVAGAAFGWIPGSVGILLLPVWADLSAAGGYRVLEILTLPLLQTISALSVVATGRLSRAHHARSGFIAEMTRVLVWFGVLGGAYTGLLAVAGTDVVHFVYGGKYDDIADSIIILAPSCVFYAAGAAFLCTLQSIRRPDLSFRASVVTAVTAVVTAIGLVPQWGIAGAAWSWTASTVVSAICLGVLVRGRLRAMRE